MHDRVDPELFNFELEVEPILQVLVGKSLELARIEVIEEFEKNQMEAARAVYKQKREAALVQTQRLEAGRKRRDDEHDRRVLQQRTKKIIDINQEK